MHPPLTLSKHPLCVEAIAALQACHEAHPWAKLLGACNDQKWALDDCFKAEVRHLRSCSAACARALKRRARAQKQWKRKANFEKAKASQARYAAERAAEAASAAK